MTTQANTISTRTLKEWECYLDTPQAIVDAVNMLTKHHLITSHTPEDALQSIFDMLDTFSHHGFRDTECELVAVDIINKHFDSTLHRFDYYAN